jgi:hypothetical protein
VIKDRRTAWIGCGGIRVARLPEEQCGHGEANGAMRQAMKRLEREERREQRQEAEELRRESLPDLSEFGTPAPVYRSDAPAVPHIQCTTINMGGGDSATDCF